MIITPELKIILADLLPNLGANTAIALDTELRQARQKFPTNEDQLLAEVEEHGELVKVMLDSRAEYHDETTAHIRKEAVQAAAMAIRVLHEGDKAFPYMGIPRRDR